jgi:hypothetical protein
MAANGRVKRPVPERTEPDRDWRNALDASAGKNGVNGASHAPAPAPERREASYDAVNDAYRVIDEYLRQGQRMAERVWLPMIADAAPMADFGRIFERFMRSAGEMGTAWLEMMGQWSTPPRPTEIPRGGAGPFSAGRSPERSAPPAQPDRAGKARGGGGVSVQVESRRRFEIRVDLFDSDDAGGLEIKELVGARSAKDRITGVSVESKPGARKATVRVKVPDGQRPGLYNGMLLDQTSHQPRGTVSLRLFDR